MTSVLEHLSVPGPEEFAPRLVLPPEIVMATDPESPDWMAAADLEAQVFIESGYVRTREELEAEEAPYLARTTMAALKLGAEVPGATRIYDRSEGVGFGFKTINDALNGRLELDDNGRRMVEAMDLDRTLEVGTIALMEKFRGIHGFKLVGYLYEGIYNMAVAAGHDNVIASFDARFFGGFRRRFAPAVTALGPARQYMGSLTIPAHIDVATIDPRKFH